MSGFGECLRSILVLKSEISSLTVQSVQSNKKLAILQLMAQLQSNIKRLESQYKITSEEIDDEIESKLQSMTEDDINSIIEETAKENTPSTTMYNNNKQNTNTKTNINDERDDKKSEEILMGIEKKRNENKVINTIEIIANNSKDIEEFEKKIRIAQEIKPNKSEMSDKFEHLAIATRVFQHNRSFDERKKEIRITNFINQALNYCNTIYFAIDNSKLLIELLDKIIEKLVQNNKNINNSAFGSKRIEVVLINPWIGVCPALNGIIRKICHFNQGLKYKHQNKNKSSTSNLSHDNLKNVKKSANCSSRSSYKEIKYVSYQSLEISVSSHIMNTLFTKYFDDNTLCVGPCLRRDIQFDPFNQLRRTSMAITNNKNGNKTQRLSGTSQVLTINGANFSWNTLNIWNLNKLAKIGFVTVTDGIVLSETKTKDEEKDQYVVGGNEEVVTISLIQKLMGFDKNQAKLIDFGEKNDKYIVWNTIFDTKYRAEYHEKKMKTKIERPQKQMEAINLQFGKVVHVLH